MAKRSKPLDGHLRVIVRQLNEALSNGSNDEQVSCKARSAIKWFGRMERLQEYVPENHHTRLQQVAAQNRG